LTSYKSGFTELKVTVGGHTITTKEGTKAVDEAIEFVGKLSKLDVLTRSKGLN
jgi:hypothetical protein